ncbi:Proteinaceous RNase P 1 chloroplastic/mitochondrial [Bienertia sinuspersici]
MSSSSSTQDDPSLNSSSFASKSKPLSKKSRKALNETPEYILRGKLDLCSKHGNLKDALHLYNSARIDGITLSVHHYNVLLYLCALSASESGSVSSSIEGLEKGFEIFRQMGVDKVDPNEATFTSMARLAVAKKDPEMAFDLVKEMKASGISPKLRSYGPALFGFCEKGDADGAYKVDAHMLECGVVPEELELRALLKVSVDARRGDKVYEMLHRLRTVVRQVSEETARLMVDWFESETASGIGVENWDMGKVKEGVVKGGGGWHGQGWLGSGKWSVVKAEMDKKGVCCGCGEKLVCIDIDPKETESFATSLSSLACEKEKRVNFLQFQEWLKTHGPFDAVVDGANVGLINTHNFSFRQLINVVNQLQNISPSKKLPLIILHRSRVYGGPAKNPNTKRLLESWMKAGALYATPQGSNDDWYWLYAAVSSKCLLVTNDEMRDHLFQLLGNSIFPRWKEKHQVRMTVSRSGLALHMPPPYSIVIQESETGSWHIPTVIGDDLETPRQWLCATRATKTRSKIRTRAQ